MTRYFVLSCSIFTLTLALGCGDSGTADSGSGGTGSETGTGNSGGSESGTASGDGDGDTGDGDGDSGDGDGDTGDGDGDTGDGDGDTGDGDGDGDTGDGDGDTGQACGDLDCNECVACATADQGACGDQKAACAGDPDCLALGECVAGCGPIGDPQFEQCHDDCVDGMPGEAPFKDLEACLACDTCNCQDHPEC